MPAARRSFARRSWRSGSASSPPCARRAPRLTPVISLEGDAPFGWEVGLDADGPLADLASLLQAAEALGEVERLGALMRSATVRAADEVSAAALLFLRVHPRQLLTPLLTRDRAFVERASRIVLEVAQPGELRSVAQLAENLAEHRLLGFRVALHNDGVEAGSIEWMRSLQPEFAVLGAAVVRALPEDEAQRAMAELLLRVGRRARTRFIADGVERTEEREALRALGCDLMRGRLFARPDAPTGGAAP
ncbi:MAG: EAL domain-containing protein [Polyangiales bacterium]